MDSTNMSVSEKVLAGVYDIKTPHPEDPKKPQSARLSAVDLQRLPKAERVAAQTEIDNYLELVNAVKTARTERRELDTLLRAKFKEDLLNEGGLNRYIVATTGNDRLQEKIRKAFESVYTTTWEERHSSGYGEVVDLFEEMIEPVTSILDEFVSA